ncbi:hypothetical protein COY28_00490 [Candidatus Woesearchaeota archaeon CG_4_10_14_0_2_um_filter_57_5]|nr:MAG: hypothetical protein COY28_00490 [Candidatus Woesearchaeota archaeon CG_4_10_14_0_2_um_filter_57_5]
MPNFQFWHTPHRALRRMEVIGNDFPPKQESCREMAPLFKCYCPLSDGKNLAIMQLMVQLQKSIAPHLWARRSGITRGDI